jgi:hypothetical protein
MTTIKRGIIGAVGLLFALATHTFAIEGLKISVQCRDVALTWPSIPGQNYIVQYRPTLGPSTPWVTLTNSYPGDWTTNITIFVHSNIVQHPNCGGGGGSFAAMAMQSSEPNSGELVAESSEPLAQPADGSG